MTEIIEQKFNTETIHSEIEYNYASKNESTKKQVIELLHQFPAHFVQGVFERQAENDYMKSDTVLARLNNEIIGCLMFDRTTNEFNWLAVSPVLKIKRTEIAKQLFNQIYTTLEPGTTVHLFVNTEDAYIPGNNSFSGKNFAAARKFYTSMGLELKPENIIKNYYGPGAHVYKVEWNIN
jgi:hypothetical protein